MSKKLFVGGISWNITQNDLISKFEQYGEIVDAKLITDRETGKSRGFGFVTFEDANAADKAVQELDGQDWDNRTIKVSEAQERERRSFGNARGGGGGGVNRW